MDFAEIVKSIANQNNKVSIHFGVVTAITGEGATVSLTISGAATAVTDIRFLSSYTPTVNDVVVLIVNNGDIIVLGTLS